MASFCSNCGAQLSGRFCVACGAAAQGETPVAQSQATPAATSGPGTVSAPTSAAASSSGTKIVLIIAGVVVLLGGIGVAGIVYVGYRAKQKIAELKQEYGVTGESEGGSTGSAKVFPPSKGNGCRMLEGQEAAGILGVAVERVESDANGPDGSELCRYWVGPAERKRLAGAEILSGISAVDKSDEKNAVAAAEKVIGGIMSAAADASGDIKNEDFAFEIQLWRSGGRPMWDKMESAKAVAKDTTGVDLAGMTTQQVEGVGDRAMILPAGHSIMVLKGDSFFLLGFQQFVPGREKTTALAKVVVGRL